MPKTTTGDADDARESVVQVFHDGERRRWRRVRWSAAALTLALIAVAVVFIDALRATRGPGAGEREIVLDALQAEAATAGCDAVPTHVEAALESATPGAATAGAFDRRFAWVDPSEPEALASLEANGGRVTDVVVEGLHLTSGRGEVSGDVARAAVEGARAHGARVFALVDDALGGSSRRADVTALAASDEAIARFVTSLAERAQDLDGVVVSFEHDDGDEEGARRETVLRAVRDRLRADGKLTLVALDPDFSPIPAARAAGVADLVLLRAYGDPPPGAIPGPLAPHRWLDRLLGAVSAVVPKDKLVVRLPTRAAAWRVSLPDLTPVSPAGRATWSEVMAKARLGRATPGWEETSRSSIVLLPGRSGVGSSDLVLADPEDDGRFAELAWFPDGASFADSLATARRHGVRAIGVDGLGGEDPRVWRVLAAEDPSAVLTALGVVVRPAGWEVLGNGVEMRVFGDEHDGSATIALDAAGGVALQRYDLLPASVTIARRAQVPAKTVVLTFDDGPDAEYTPRVLDILRRHDVPATFFVVGSRAEREPELLRRIVSAGHELGNHSFSHPDLGRGTERAADMEIRSTNLLLEATVGRSTLLFRPPFRCDDAPADPEDVVAIARGTSNGMTTVGSTIDPRDWERPGAKEIQDFTVSRAEKDSGGVVLLHDGGGDRSQTLEALEPMIIALKAKGFRFAQVRDVFGGRSMDAVNPPVPTAFQRSVSRVVWLGGTWGMRALQIVATIALVLGSVRFATLILGASLDLALRRRRRGSAEEQRRFTSLVPASVIIPAYNEAKVIERTIRSVLGSRNVDLEVIVLDDGSTDGTADIVERLFADDPRVRLLRLTNGGKARALNIGFRAASYDVVVALDADTIFLPNTIEELVKPFSDLCVAAVAGRAVVGNPRGFIGRWQALEYVIGQAIERRAWRLLGVVSVVPGAVGAWRRGAVLAVGGFGRDTLAEDCDMTMALQVLGWRVEYAEDAIGLTEAPETVRALIKQRFRWSFGVLQAMWKHKGAMVRPPHGNRAVGILLMPAVLLSHLATPLFAPLADLAAIVAMYLGYTHAILPYMLALLGLELALTAFGMRVGRASPRLAWDYLLHRAAYRVILFVALARAVVAALRGGAVGWGKLVRTGSVRLPAEAKAA